MKTLLRRALGAGLGLLLLAGLAAAETRPAGDAAPTVEKVAA